MTPLCFHCFLLNLCKACGDETRRNSITGRRFCFPALKLLAWFTFVICRVKLHPWFSDTVIINQEGERFKHSGGVYNSSLYDNFGSVYVDFGFTPPHWRFVVVNTAPLEKVFIECILFFVIFLLFSPMLINST